MNRSMILCVMFVLAFATQTIYAGNVTATSVTAKQRYPWNGKVDIVVTLEGESNDVANVECYFFATNKLTNAAIPVAHIEQLESDFGSDTIWRRCFVWDAATDAGNVKIDKVILAVTAQFYVQLWKDGPCWAKCNVGAERPEDYGYYFWWGDTVGYKRNSSNDGWVSVKDGSSFSFSSGNAPTYGKSNSTLLSNGYIDSTGNLTSEHDAATAHLGAPWRMPTEAEMSALISNCNTIWTNRNGVAGQLVTGKGDYASRSIFLPAAGYGSSSYLRSSGSYGYYWSSSPNSDYSDSAWYLGFCSGDFYRSDYGRYGGQSVRSVRGFAE